ncbi:hypothetical protein NIES3974_08540 [Calothrix sp. NIES-3974]|nr:hypothetical protein NIES3974_08540 [Calothrix sp. NIES-3974]
MRSEDSKKVFLRSHLIPLLGVQTTRRVVCTGRREAGLNHLLTGIVAFIIRRIHVKLCIENFAITSFKIMFTHPDFEYQQGGVGF